MGGPPGSSSGSGRPGAKTGGVAVALKLPCATLDEVKARHPELKARSFFVRTSQPLAMDTVIRLKTQLSDGTPCFRAAAVVERVQSAGGPPGSMPGMTLSLMRMDDAGRELVAWMGGKPPALLVEAPPPAAKPAVPSGGPAAKPAVPSSGPASKPPPAAPKSPAAPAKPPPAPAKPPPAAKPSPTAASGPPAARPSPATPKASPPSKPPSAPPAAPPPAAPQGPLDDLPPPDDWDAPPAATAPAPAPATPPPASPAPPPPSAARAPEPATSPAASPAADGGDPWALPSEAGGWAAQAAGSPPAGAASSQADELEMSWDPEADAGDAAAQPATGTPEAWLEAPAEAKPPPPPTPPAPRAPPVPASPASPAAAAPTPAAAAPTPAAAAPTPAAAAPTPAAAAPTPAAAAPPPAPPSAAPAWPPPAEAAAAPPAAPAPAATPKAPPAPAGPARAASPAPAPAPPSPSASAPPGAAARPAGPLPAAAKGAPAPASPPKAPPAPVPSARPPGSRPGDLPPPQQSHQSRRPEAPLPRPTLAPGTKAEPAPAADYPEHLEAAVPAKRDGPAKGPIIGIDLGTTNSCAAVVRDGKPFIIPSREGYNTIPSVVAVSDKGKLMVGHPAKGQLLINPRSTVYGAKRLIGRQFNSPVVSEMVGRFSYEIVAGQRGEAAVKLGGQVFSLQKISSLVLAEVKDLAQQWLGSEVSRAVITVPAYYNDNQRQAVRAAGALAGLEVERILNEPTAAAIAFAHGRKLEQRVMVYDLGGGTFDTSVLQLRGNVYEVISTGGDTFLGGVDFDKALVGELLARFKQKHGMEFPGDRVAYQRVVDAAERAKIALSERLTTQANVPFVALINDKAYDLDTTVSRAELEKLTAGLIDRSLSVCDQVLTSCGLKPSDIGDVLIVGGQSRMPLVRAKLREFFGKEPSKAVHPDEAVALGAAVLAQSIQSDEIGGMVLVDVLPMSIGIGLPGGRFKKVVERNTSLPYKKTHSIWTSQDNQKTLEIPVFQGENLRARDNEYLGTLVVPDLPPGTRGNVVFDIVFSISAESILTVSAEERGTARSVSATFSTQDTPEAVKRRLSGAAAGADEPQAAPAAAAKEAKGGWMKRIFGGS